MGGGRGGGRYKISLCASVVVAASAATNRTHAGFPAPSAGLSLLRAPSRAFSVTAVAGSNSVGVRRLHRRLLGHHQVHDHLVAPCAEAGVFDDFLAVLPAASALFAAGGRHGDAD